MSPRAAAPARPAARDARVAVACALAADAKLGEDTLVLDVRGLSAVSDWIVVTTGTAAPHLKALADAVAEALELAGGRLHHIEGDARATWILLDAHDILIHVFDAAARRHYDLERLWDDARRVPWNPGRVVPRPAKRAGPAPAVRAAPSRGPKRAGTKRGKVR